MATLTEADVIRIMREEWAAGVNSLREQVDIAMTVPAVAGEEPVIIPGLKVRHRDSRFLYTVCSVGPDDVILLTPEGDQFVVDSADFERDYSLS